MYDIARLDEAIPRTIGVERSHKRLTCDAVDDARRTEDALLTLAFSLHSNPGAYALLLGAGVSAPSILTAWGVLSDLADRLATLRGHQPDDPIAWYAAEYGEEPRYETMLERLAPTPIERQRLLRSYFEPTTDESEAGQKKPAAAHRAIARLVKTKAVRVILTLNFDRLIEQALRAEGLEPVVAATPSDVAGLAPLHTLECCVIHLHGDYLNPTSMRNTTAELGEYADATSTLLQRVLEDYGLIIAGWSSIYDPALRAAIAAHYPARLTPAWIEPGKLADQATELLVSKKGLAIAADADTAFGRLADAVDALRARDARHPLTLPVAVETAKRELSGQRVAIGLHDVLGAEFQRLHDLPEFHLPSHQSDAPYGGYEAMLERVEEASKPACGLLATLAYWGNNQTDAWWLGELARFATQARGDGLTKLLTLRLVSGVALFYSAGIAAVASGRYQLLQHMFRQTRPNPYRSEREPLAVALGATVGYESATNQGTRLRTLLEPILRTATGLGREPLEEAWQMFEILRLATALMTDPRFGELCSQYKRANAELATSQREYEEAQKASTELSGPQARRQTASVERGRQLGLLMRLHAVGRPHILVNDMRLTESYQSDLALRLIEDLEAEAEEHPLARALNCAADDLAAAVTAVSTHVGMIGREQAWSRVSHAAGIIPSEVWVDTGQTPEEAASL